MQPASFSTLQTPFRRCRGDGLGSCCARPRSRRRSSAPSSFSTGTSSRCSSSAGRSSLSWPCVTELSRVARLAGRFSLCASTRCCGESHVFLAGAVVCSRMRTTWRSWCAGSLRSFLRWCHCSLVGALRRGSCCVCPSRSSCGWAGGRRRARGSDWLRERRKLQTFALTARRGTLGSTWGRTPRATSGRRLWGACWRGRPR